MKVTFMARGVVLLVLASIGRGQMYRQYYPLIANCKLVRAAPAILESGGAIRQAINKVIPNPPRDQKFADTEVVVTRAVAASGQPQSIAATARSTLAESGFGAAKGWKFNPYIVKGQAVSFVTRLIFLLTQQKVWVE